MAAKPKKPKRPPATPAERKKAEKWFRARVPMKKGQWETLSAGAQKKSFTVARATQLHIVQSMLDSLSRAVSKQESFASWRAGLIGEVSDKFLKASSPYLKTVYQTNVQTALNAGRYLQMDDKGYRIYDAVLDAKTTTLCKSLNGTIVEADNAMLRWMWPPLHFNCRTVVRVVSAAIARRRGVTMQWLGERPMLGFGKAPDYDDDYDDMIDESGFDPDVMAIYKGKKTAPRRLKAS